MRTLLPLISEQHFNSGPFRKRYTHIVFSFRSVPRFGLIRIRAPKISVRRDRLWQTELEPEKLAGSEWDMRHQICEIDPVWLIQNQEVSDYCISQDRPVLLVCSRETLKELTTRMSASQPFSIIPSMVSFRISRHVITLSQTSSSTGCTESEGEENLHSFRISFVFPKDIISL